MVRPEHVGSKFASGDRTGGPYQLPCRRNESRWATLRGAGQFVVRQARERMEIGLPSTLAALIHLGSLRRRCEQNSITYSLSLPTTVERRRHPRCLSGCPRESPQSARSCRFCLALSAQTRPSSRTKQRSLRASKPVLALMVAASRKQTLAGSVQFRMISRKGPDRKLANSPSSVLKPSS